MLCCSPLDVDSRHNSLNSSSVALTDLAQSNEVSPWSNCQVALSSDAVAHIAKRSFSLLADLKLDSSRRNSSFHSLKQRSCSQAGANVSGPIRRGRRGQNRQRGAWLGGPEESAAEEQDSNADEDWDDSSEVAAESSAYVQVGLCEMYNPGCR